MVACQCALFESLHLAVSIDDSFGIEGFGLRYLGDRCRYELKDPLTGVTGC